LLCKCIGTVIFVRKHSVETALSRTTGSCKTLYAIAATKNNMTITKEIWRQKWLNSVNELTSFDLQEKSWLDNSNTNPHWTFVEFMCSYFDDLFISETYNDFVEKGWLTQEEYRIVKEWHDALDKYESPNKNDYDNVAILKDQKWLDILKLGIAAKTKLLEIVNEKEKEYLTTTKADTGA
jgi:hypothetical protein